MTADPLPGEQPPTPALARGAFDRAAEERGSDVLSAARADAATRVLVVHDDAAPVEAGERPALHYVSPADVPEGAQWAFIGRQHVDAAHERAAVLCAAFPAEAPQPFPAPGRWLRLRTVGGDLGDVDAGVFVEALSLGRWLLDAPYCPACGALTEIENAGWSRRCPACGREHFPRTDPAVIVAVSSADRERLLLGSNALWGQDRYSCFAGFVEAGESLEAAIEREVREESGIRVAETVYRGSQAWPYPRSLMLGFHARALSDDDARADGEEIVQVRWFARPELEAAFAGESEVTLPGPASIAYSLIRDWVDAR